MSTVVFFAFATIFAVVIAAEAKPMDDVKPMDGAKPQAEAVRRRFYQWAGKRAAEEQLDGKSFDGVEKRRFYQWAGKRDNADADDS